MKGYGATRFIRCGPIGDHAHDWDLKLLLLRWGFLDSVERVFISRFELNTRDLGVTRSRYGYIQFKDVAHAIQLMFEYHNKG